MQAPHSIIPQSGDVCHPIVTLHLIALTRFIISTAGLYLLGAGHVPSLLATEAVPSTVPGLGNVLLKTHRNKE